MPNVPTLTDKLCRIIGHTRLPGVNRLLWKAGKFSRSVDTEFEIDFDGRRYRGNLGDFIDRHIYFTGAYAPAELGFLDQAALAFRKTGGGEVTFIDIGANCGQHSLFMSRRADRVIAFEPSAEAAGRLEANLALNGISNVALFRIALGDRDHTAQLGSGLPGNSGSRSLTWTLDAEQNENVEVRHAADFLDSPNVCLTRMDIIKLDVEGYEKAVLKGLAPLLKRDRPVLMFELVGKQIKGGFASPDELRAHLYPDAAMFTLSGRRRPALTPFDWNAEEAVCIPQERVSVFDGMIAQ